MSQRKLIVTLTIAILLAVSAGVSQASVSPWKAWASTFRC